MTLLALGALACSRQPATTPPEAHPDTLMDAGGTADRNTNHDRPAEEALDVGRDSGPQAASDAAPDRVLGSPPDISAPDVAPAICVGASASCRTHDDCCAGFFCALHAFRPRTCAAQVGLEAPCQEDRQCQSTSCRSRCVTCSAVGGICGVDRDCCGGGFCENEVSGPWRCLHARPTGAPCSRNAHCESQLCVKNACAPPGRKRIFHYRSGTLGKIRDSADPQPGIEAADADCIGEAIHQRLGGEWKAWISSSMVNAIDRIADVGPWYRLDGETMLFENKAQLRLGPSAPIAPTVDAHPRTLFWTGTALDGTKTAFTCEDWTTYLRGGGTVGRADVAGSAWVRTEPLSCGTYLAILCIEQ